MLHTVVDIDVLMLCTLKTYYDIISIDTAVLSVWLSWLQYDIIFVDIADTMNNFGVL
jgi:hypothetical protein